MISEYKVTLLVLILLNESYIFSVVFWDKLYMKERIFFYFWKPGHAHPALGLVWQKVNDSIPGADQSFSFDLKHHIKIFVALNRSLPLEYHLPGVASIGSNCKTLLELPTTSSLPRRVLWDSVTSSSGLLSWFAETSVSWETAEGETFFSWPQCLCKFNSNTSWWLETHLPNMLWMILIFAVNVFVLYNVCTPSCNAVDSRRPCPRLPRLPKVVLRGA